MCSSKKGGQGAARDWTEGQRGRGSDGGEMVEVGVVEMGVVEVGGGSGGGGSGGGGSG